MSVVRGLLAGWMACHFNIAFSFSWTVSRRFKAIVERLLVLKKVLRIDDELRKRPIAASCPERRQRRSKAPAKPGKTKPEFVYIYFCVVVRVWLES